MDCGSHWPSPAWWTPSAVPTLHASTDKVRASSSPSEQWMAWGPMTTRVVIIISINLWSWWSYTPPVWKAFWHQRQAWNSKVLPKSEIWSVYIARILDLKEIWEPCHVLQVMLCDTSAKFDWIHLCFFQPWSSWPHEISLAIRQLASCSSIIIAWFMNIWSRIWGKRDIRYIYIDLY